MYAESLAHLGDIVRQQGDVAACLDLLERAAELFGRLGAEHSEADTRFRLGHALLDGRDLDGAERAYRRAGELIGDSDPTMLARITAQRGQVAYERFRDASRAGEPAAVRVGHLRDAWTAYGEALELTPRHLAADRARYCNALGNVYGDASQPGPALRFYQEAIRLFEEIGDAYQAGETRYNVAVTLSAADRTADALRYAEAARRDFASFGDRAADGVARVDALVALLDPGLSPSSG